MRGNEAISNELLLFCHCEATKQSQKLDRSSAALLDRAMTKKLELYNKIK
ncbi:hypothetical protein ACN4EE_19250 [Geminocystis sp. CENA526]